MAENIPQLPQHDNPRTLGLPTLTTMVHTATQNTHGTNETPELRHH